MLTDVETRGTKHTTHRALLLLPNNIHLFSTFSFEGETLLLLLSFFFFRKLGYGTHAQWSPLHPDPELLHTIEPH